MALNSCGPAGIAGRAIFPGGASANIETNIYIIKGIRETDGSLFSIADLYSVYFTDIGLVKTAAFFNGFRSAGRPQKPGKSFWLYVKPVTHL